MNNTKITDIAASHGITTDQLNKTQLIHAIQSKEGHETCFAKEATTCEQTQCTWRKHCYQYSSRNLRRSSNAQQQGTPYV